jgi:hypothetical protein
MDAMNLGVIYLESAFTLLGIGFLLGTVLTIVFLLAKRKRLRFSTTVFGTFLLGLPLAGVGLVLGHAPLFRVWHRAQNDAMPADGCLTYEPSLVDLFASYKMDRPTFDAWVASHPWQLAPCSLSGFDRPFEVRDRPHFGLTTCEAAYESPRGPKCNNLRVYYQDGVVYLSYTVF